MSISEIARKAIEARLGKHSGQGERPVPFASLGRSGRKHTARDMEESLAKEWTVENLIDRNR
jgi:hypothetical protein